MSKGNELKCSPGASNQTGSAMQPSNLRTGVSCCSATMQNVNDGVNNVTLKMAF